MDFYGWLIVGLPLIGAGILFSIVLPKFVFH
jgi:hypothetical protein